jgi:integrase
MLNWARTVRVNGQRLLAANPLAGLRRPSDPSPRSPVATWDRFVTSRNKLQELRTNSKSETERARWLKIELALVLAEAAGRRLGAIRHLRWEDIDFERRTIRWRQEHDKKRKEYIVPVPDALVGELRAFQCLLGTTAGWVFAAEEDADVPMDRKMFDKWLRYAEKQAGLPKLEGGLWHPYRRAWATARKHLPLTDVAAAGGWKDTSTLLRCYMRPTNDQLLAVMSEPQKVRDMAVIAAH